MLGTLADLLGNANGQTPLVLLVGGAVFLAAAWIGVRVFRSMQRQGARIGRLEQVARSERTRRRQVEQVLREHRIRLPFWPDDPAELYAVQFHDQDDELVDEQLVDDSGPDTEVDIPPTRYLDAASVYPTLARHRRSHP